MMNHFEVEEALETIKLLVDTREKPTKKLQARIEMVGWPWERVKLPQGDYSAECLLPSGEVFSLANKLVIERKMNIEELCMCFGSERKRFEREFERAKEAGCKIHLLVEEATWRKIYSHKYRSKYNPNALIASINAYRARYDMQLDFCSAELTGYLIRDILYREMKERLQNDA